VSRRTLRRCLNDNVLFGRHARKQKKFTNEHLKKRISFAEGYGGWKYEQWSRVEWSDESSFYLGPNNGVIWVQRPVGEAYNPTYMAVGKEAQFTCQFVCASCTEHATSL